MLVYCTIYHHKYCFDVKKKELTESNSFGVIETIKKDKENKTIYKYCILSCFQYEHPVSYPQETNDNGTGDLPSVTPASSWL